MNEIIKWQHLLEIYQNSSWIDEAIADLYIANQNILDTLNLLEVSDRAAHDADISLLEDIKLAAIGTTIKVRIGYPQLRIGLFADDVDSFLKSPKSYFAERPNYYIRSINFHSGMDILPEEIMRYRALLKFVQLLEKAALYTDKNTNDIVYFQDKKLEIKVDYNQQFLESLNVSGVEEVCDFLSNRIDKDHCLGIFSEAVISLVSSQPKSERFGFLLRNVTELLESLKDSYILYISSFSYSKIKEQAEKNQTEYINRVHKTFTDIQGQILGLPIASVVVATQLKNVEACGIEFWTNTSVLFGAILFAIFLTFSCFNQWLTLDAIGSEVNYQKNKLSSDFKKIEHLFVDNFEAIQQRIFWHNCILFVITLVALLGAIFVIFAYLSVTKVGFSKCAFMLMQ